MCVCVSFLLLLSLEVVREKKGVRARSERTERTRSPHFFISRASSGPPFFASLRSGLINRETKQQQQQQQQQPTRLSRVEVVDWSSTEKKNKKKSRRKGTGDGRRKLLPRDAYDAMRFRSLYLEEGRRQYGGGGGCEELDGSDSRDNFPGYRRQRCAFHVVCVCACRVCVCVYTYVCI